MDILWDEVNPELDVGLVHTIHQGQRRRKYIRRRGYVSAREAITNYFMYLDAMSAAGYSVKSVLGKGWYYEVYLGEVLVETVEVDWPATDWKKETTKLLGNKK